MSAGALSIIARLQEAGATLECKDGGRVRFSAPVPLPATLLAEAREHREAIAAALATNTAPVRTRGEITAPPMHQNARWRLGTCLAVDSFIAPRALKTGSMARARLPPVARRR